MQVHGICLNAEETKVKNILSPLSDKIAISRFSYHSLAKNVKVANSQNDYNRRTWHSSV
jgi:hypothetical protein